MFVCVHFPALTVEIFPGSPSGRGPDSFFFFFFFCPGGGPTILQKWCIVTLGAAAGVFLFCLYQFSSSKIMMTVSKKTSRSISGRKYIQEFNAGNHTPLEKQQQHHNMATKSLHVENFSLSHDPPIAVEGGGTKSTLHLGPTFSTFSCATQKRLANIALPVCVGIKLCWVMVPSKLEYLGRAEP